MSIVSLFVGLDYHLASIQVCVMNGTGEVLVNRKCPNQWQAVVKVVSSLGDIQVHAAIEACSGAANLADELVQNAGWSIDLAHPG